MICEACGGFNNYSGLSPKFKFSCLPCIDDGWAVECEYSGEWHVRLKCRGCSREGAANYGVSQGDSLEYYCGGSPNCCP